MEPKCDYCDAYDKFRCKTEDQARQCKLDKMKRELNHLKYSKNDLISIQWKTFDKILGWINEQEFKLISKGDLYDAVMEMRTEQE